MNHMKRLPTSPAQRSKRPTHRTTLYPDRWDLSDLIHDPVAGHGQCQWLPHRRGPKSGGDWKIRARVFVAGARAPRGWSFTTSMPVRTGPVVVP